ncbi:MAG: NYN domain-containing protein [Deltaproteobacteria bacterium]|nr:NYN domain-containing protein [Deltaproteobacteria bacterium]
MEVGFASQRVAILIHEVNIYLTAAQLFNGSKVNFEKILETLNRRQITRAILYCIETSELETSAFFKKVTSLNFEVKKKPLKIYPNGRKKGDWDIGIAIDAVSLAEKVDVISLITGDGDYEPLVHYLKSKGVRVEVMGFPEMTSRDLVRSVDKFIPITKDMLLEQ